MNILLDEQGYFTGNYAVKGKIVGGVEISELPPYEDMKKQISCKFENEKWIFDEEKYQEILKQEAEEEKQAKIQKQKENVYYVYQDYLEELEKSKRIGTANAYRNSMKSLQKFKPKLSFAEITPKFLERYEANMWFLKVNR